MSETNGESKRLAIRRILNEEIFGKPNIHPGAFVMEEVIGNVIIGDKVIAVAGTHIRADECGPFFIGKGTNIQDGVILHGLLNQFVPVDGAEYSIYIGSHCALAHACLIHGPAFVGKKSFIGAQAQVWASKIREKCSIGGQAMVKDSEIGPGCFIGDGAKVKGVIVPPSRYIEDFCIIRKQEEADDLPEVPEWARKKALEFGKEVVDTNKTLVELYRIAEKKMEALS